MHAKLFLTKAAEASVIHSNSSAISLEKPMSSGIHTMKTQKVWDMANREVILGVLHNQFNKINDSSPSSLLLVDRSKVEFNHTAATCLILPPGKELSAKEMVGCCVQNRGSNLQEGVEVLYLHIK
jgi:hypothetical protein